MARCEPFSGKPLKVIDVEDSDESADSEIAALDTAGGHFMTEKEPESSENKVSDAGIIDARDIPELFIDDSPESGVESVDSQDAVNRVDNDGDLEEHPNLVPLSVIKNTSFDSSVPEASVPPRCNWEGEYKFKIKVDCTRNATKSESHSLFCESKNKLFVSKDCPFKILVSAANVPPGSIIRVYAAFCHVEDAYNVVQRCPTHIQQDYAKGNPAYEHVVQCVSEAASYDKNMAGRLSVSVPYRKPQSGETYSLYLFKLTCFNSCVGGINRRSFVMVFNLEKDGITLGRQIIEARVCACPLRDFNAEMDKERSQKSVDTNVPSSNPVVTSKKFTISVKDPELYNFLRQMKSFYETGAFVKQKMNIDT